MRRLIAVAALLLWGGAAATQPNPSAQWVTLGTAGGPPIQADQAQISNALVVNGAVYVFDAGLGLIRQMVRARLPLPAVTAVFLSHHHIDHNAEVGPLLIQEWLFRRGRPAIGVYGPPGTVRLVDGLIGANAPTVLASFPTDGATNPPLTGVFAAHDLPARMDTVTPIYQDANVRISAIGVDHFQQPPTTPLPVMPQAVAYRIEAGGKVFVYSGDTGPSANLRTLAKDADVLVTEVVDLDAIGRSLARMMPGAPPSRAATMAANMAHNHLVPEEIGRLAAAADVKRVVLTHFVPAGPDQPDPARLTAAIRRNYAGPVTIARDLDRF